MSSMEEVARAVINEARQRGIKVPDGDEVEAASRLLELAQEAFDRGAQGEQVTVILKTGELLKQLQAEIGDTKDPPPAEPLESTGDSAPAQEAPKEVVKPILDRERFPVPPEIEGDPPEMARDISTLGDRELRALIGEFNAWLNRVTFLIGVEKSDLANAETIMDWKLRDARKAARARLQLADPKASQAAINAVAEEDDEYRDWTMRVSQHKANLAQLYALRDIYNGNVERLSYDWKIRRDAWQMAGGQA